MVIRKRSHTRLLLIGSMLAILFSPSDTQLFSSPPKRPSASSTRASSGKSLSPAATQACRDQLAKIPELLADPDPNARTASMEAILSTNDTTMIQIAMRLAFQSDDVNLRSLAMRSYIAGLKGLTFDILLPPQIQAQFDAIQYDPDLLADFYKKHLYVRYLASHSNQVHLLFSKYTFESNAGSVSEVTVPGSVRAFTITGDRIATSVDMFFFGFTTSCSIEFRPDNDMLFAGTLKCNDTGNAHAIFPKLSITSPIF